MHRQAIDQLLPLLTRDLQTGSLTPASVGAQITHAAGGTDAEGAWTWRQAYDLVQSAAILADRDLPAESDPEARLAMLTAGASARPTETRRSEAQVRLQQFSTSLPYAYVAACAAAIRPGDVALEPSAGTGALAHTAARAGAALVLNEIDPFRAKLLEATFRGSSSAASPGSAETGGCRRTTSSAYRRRKHISPSPPAPKCFAVSRRDDFSHVLLSGHLSF